MYCNFIFKSYHTQYPSFKIFYNTPKSKSVTLLLLNTKWIFQHMNASLFFDIGPFSEHLFLKIISEFILHTIILLIDS
jgi:hypothetical protein